MLEAYSNSSRKRLKGRDQGINGDKHDMVQLNEVWNHRAGQNPQVFQAQGITRYDHGRDLPWASML
jgi:hypothetical protein